MCPKLHDYDGVIFEFVYLILTQTNHIIAVQRPESVKIDARDVNGMRFSISLSGLPARIFQHEFDHLEVCFFFNLQK